MTELDHTSFDTLMADLTLPALARHIFCFIDQHGAVGQLWHFTKMERLLLVHHISLVVEYGSLDTGAWVTLFPDACYVWELRNGSLCGRSNNRYKIVLMNPQANPCPLNLDALLRRRLNRNLRGVFA